MRHFFVGTYARAGTSEQTCCYSCHHGGPRLLGMLVLPGVGKCLSPGNCATTRIPWLQQGQRITSILATRAMNALADSRAAGLFTGMCNAACASFTPLLAEASTP